MVNALYITISCNLAKRFLNFLKEDLEKIGINNIEIDRKNNQIKTNDFIVTAKSIYEPCVSLDCRRANYYIEDISTAHYEREEIRNITLERFRHLKSAFRRETKEINGKDELIKILMENNAEVAE